MTYSIAKLAEFSGIKPHTIRVWEQRYNALQPIRSEGNVRYYDHEQLRRLLNIVTLSKAGYKVASLCSMSDSELFNMLQTFSKDSDDYFVSQMLTAGMVYDEQSFDKLFSHALLRFGVENTYLNIIYPLLLRLGVMWSSNVIPPVQEHFISNLISRKFQTAIDSLPMAKSDKPTWILFLPEDEYHEIGLLMANYIIRLHGGQVVYLGANVPHDNLYEVVKSTKARNILSMLIHKTTAEKISTLVKNLQDSFPVLNVYICCQPAQKVESNGVHWIHNMKELQQHVA